MEVSEPPTVEAPAHIDPLRIDRIDDDELSAALGHPQCASISTLRAAVSVNADPATWELRRLLGEANTRQQEEHRVSADPLFQDVDVTGGGLGRSARYGWHYLTWLRPLILAYGASGEQRYLRRFEELFTQWDLRRGEARGEWPSLDVIWYSLGVAGRGQIIFEALAVFGEHLADEVWARLVKVVLGGARWSYDEHTSFRPGNWQLACAARLSEAADVLPGCVEGSSWSRRATDRLLEHLDHDFTADGGHSERSPGYHAMCVGLLQTAAYTGLLNGSPTLAEHPAFLATHSWLAELTDRGGFTYPFQDSGVDWPGRLMLRGAALTRNPRLAGLAQYWLAESWDSEFEALPAALRRRLPDPRGPRPDERHSVHLESSAYLLMRSPFSRAGLTVATGYGPRVGQELESHSHLAAFDITLTGADGILLWEGGGPETYDVPDYHSWYQATRAHNSITLGERSMESDHAARLESLVIGTESDVACGSHHGYGHQEKRRISLMKNDPSYVVLEDEGEDTGDRILRLHAIRPWRRVSEQRDATSWWTVDGGSLHVALLDTVAEPRAVTLGSSRVPDVASRQSPYGPLHTLEIPVPAASRVVLVPGLSGELPRIERSDANVVLRWKNATDTIGPQGLSRASSIGGDAGQR